ncbi:DUF5926 family protein [Schaalia sp. ZJ1691]|uniref:DUF5926 family protein n=1 Tax=Schaalia sp. ZJ1691 TaxID=2709404 RepID=UPI0013EA6779|nr:DUF5926 family protein [Schaalia sp. ZJ1691]
MGKASRRKKVTDPAKLKAYRAPIPFVARPFEGMTKEVELVAMREIIPAAIMSARTTPEHGGIECDLVTLLPDGRAAMVRSDGRVLVALQTRFNSGDLSHDVGAAVLAAIAAQKAGTEGIVDIDVRDPSERLQDILDPEGFGDLDITDDFGFWFDPTEEIDADTRRALEENRADIIPTEAVADVEGMYWCSMNRNFVRYVTDIDESALFNGLARLGAQGTANVGEGSRFVGAFRALGIAIPVFELGEGVSAADVAPEAQAFAKRLDEALALTDPLSDDERRIRAGMVSRQVTIR